MRVHMLAAVIAACAFTNPAWAVFKCQDANGRFSFQETPCAAGSKGGEIDVKPAAGHAAKPAAVTAPPQPSDSAAAVPAAKPMSEAERLNAQAATIRKRNRLSDLKNRHIPDAYGAVENSKNQCELRMAGLRNNKRFATNNLAGATYENSLSTEMQALATQCDSDQRRLNRDLDRLLAERKDIETSLGQ